MQQLKGVVEWMGQGQGYTPALSSRFGSEDSFRGQPVCPLGISGFSSFAHGFCLTLVLVIFCFWCSSRNLTVFNEVCGWPFKRRHDTSLMRMKEPYSQSSYFL